MKAETTENMIDDLRPEYEFDFSTAERGRYARRLKMEGANLILQVDNLGKSMPDSAAANCTMFH